MKIIGLTGTSGSGKTTVCKILKEEYDAEIIDCDKVAKELSKRGTLYLQSIVEAFGTEIVDNEGELKRKELADMIYTDNEKREKLNQLTFLYIVEEIKKRINLANKKMIVVDAPLLFESNLNQLCDFVIGVIANEALKLERIQNRDHITKEEAQKRLKVQQSNEFFEENADVVIRNEKDMKFLEEQIKKIKF